MSGLDERTDLEQGPRTSEACLPAVRRLAALVARDASPADVFAALAEEAAALLDMPLAALDRYEPDGSSVVLGACGDGPMQVGVRSSNDGPGLRRWVRETGRPARVDHFNPDSARDRPAHPGGRRSVGVGVPIMVGDVVWGGIFAGAYQALPLAKDGERRLEVLAELAAPAVLNAQARVDLSESEGRYRNAIAQAGAVPYVYSYAENRYTFIGEGIESLTGYTSDEFTPDRFNEMIEDTVLLADEPASTDDEHAGTPEARGVRWRADQKIRTRTGDIRWVADTSVEIAGPEGRSVVGMLQDITERKRTEEDARRLADEQAALRRVATLVAQEARPADVFAAVAREAAELLATPVIVMVRYEPDATATVIATTIESQFPLGTTWPLEGFSITATIYETGAPSRVDDYADLPGAIAERVRSSGTRSAIGVPIRVDRKVWGAMLALSPSAEPLPPESESRLAGFTELAAVAVSNAQARDELIASRARIVTAADEARLRIERDLHDGTQQQLLTLDMELQLLQANLESEPQDARAQLERARELLGTVLEDVQEISRGVHPATLSQRGLGPALRALARRSVVPADVQVDVPDRLPPSIELAAYYTVSEALANVAKHADASHVAVTVDVVGNRLRASVRDDGRGGADTDSGSGLSGLIDRVGALGGQLRLVSPPGEGTEVTVQLPLDGQSSAD